MTPPIFGITGWKNSGKTTLVERLVAAFSRRGLRVATVKHAHHGFDIDTPGTDSHRHRMAGAGEVAIVSGKRWALMHELAGEAEPTLAQILPRLSPCDLILVEGYKLEAHPKIECRRNGSRNEAPIFADNETIVAIASDGQGQTGGLPVFSIDDVAAIADFIADYVKIGGQ